MSVCISEISYFSEDLFKWYQSKIVNMFWAIYDLLCKNSWRKLSEAKETIEIGETVYIQNIFQQNQHNRQSINQRKKILYYKSSKEF